MTSEERFTKIENHLSAIAEHHAQYEEDLGRMQGMLESVIGVVGSLAEAQERTNAEIGKLTQAQQRTDAALFRLTEAQDRSEYKLNALINTVDRIVQGGK